MLIHDLEALGAALAALEEPLILVLASRTDYAPARLLLPTVAAFLRRNVQPWEAFPDIDGFILETYQSVLRSLCVGRPIPSPRSGQLRDLAVLDLLARRVHLGAFHAARLKRDMAQAMLTMSEEDALQALTRPGVETVIRERVLFKASRLLPSAVEPERFGRFYAQVVFPLTKRGTLLHLKRTHSDLATCSRNDRLRHVLPRPANPA